MGCSQSNETDNIVKKYEIQPYDDDVSIKKLGFLALIVGLQMQRAHVQIA